WKSKRAKQALTIDGELGEVGEPAEEINQQMLRVEPIVLEVGPDLANLADPDNPESRGELLERLKQVRRRIAMEFGVIAPGVRVRADGWVSGGQYQVRLKGDLVAEGDVLVTHLLGIGHTLGVPGVEVEHTTDPIYGTPAVWVPKQYEAEAEAVGLNVFDAQD